MKKFVAFILLAVFTTTLYAAAANSAAIAKQVKDGKVVWLENDGKKFLAVFKPATSEEQHGAILILPDRGGNPDSPEVIAPLRQQLPEFGWATLSISLPEDVIAKEEQAMAQLAKAITYLQEQNNNNLVVLGYGTGGSLATKFIEKKGKNKINTLILLSAYSNATDVVAEKAGKAEKTGKDDKAGKAEQADKATKTAEKQPKEPVQPEKALPMEDALPVLDIYASNDYPKVLRQAKERLIANRKTGHKEYRQFEIMGADHFYSELDELLVKRLRSWLKRKVLKK